MTGTPPKLAFLGLIMIGFARTAVEVSGFAPPKIAAKTESTWSLQQVPQLDDTPSKSSSRREFIQQSSSAVTIAAAISATFPADKAWASGGATAGKYTTIPIAKRRYYGRVQEAVHEFLIMGQDVVKGDVTAFTIQDFFNVNAVVIVPAKRTDVNGQCTKRDGDCRGKEVRDSRYNDMKASMYLLGNAFRTDQSKPPDRLPTVKAAKAFFKEMNDFQKIVTAAGAKSKKPQEWQQKYANALDVLDVYLDLVELPPTSSGHYDQEFDTAVGASARLT